MLPLLLASGAASGGGRTAGSLALRAAPFAIAAGVGGHLAHTATSSLAGLALAHDDPNPEHGQAVVRAFAPVPAFALAGIGIASAHSSARGTRRVVELVENADTGEQMRIARTVPRGSTAATRALRASSVGAIVGAGVAVGLAVPVAAWGAKLVGRGSEATVRAAMPDWLEGPAFAVPQAQVQVVDAVGDAARYVIDGPAPQVHSYESEFDIDPARGFDPVRDLGLSGPGEGVTIHTSDIRTVVDEKVLDGVEAATGVRPVAVDR